MQQYIQQGAESAAVSVTRTTGQSGVGSSTGDCGGSGAGVGSENMAQNTSDSSAMIPFFFRNDTLEYTEGDPLCDNNNIPVGIPEHLVPGVCDLGVLTQP